LVTDGGGVPLATIVTGANTHDVIQLLPLIKSIPTLRDPLGRRRHRPTAVLGDRAYDSRPHRRELRRHRILSLIARRNHGHGSGLGRFRWVVERTIAWLHRFRRLRVRYDRRDDIHEGFLALGCAVVC
jgi:transposase